MNDGKSRSIRLPVRHWSEVAGIYFIVIGLVVLADLSLQTGWLTLIILPAIGLSFLAGGFYQRRVGLLIAGSLTLGLGTGVFILFSQSLALDMLARFGALLLAFGASWFLIPLFTYWLLRRVAWWALIPGGVIVGAGLAMVSEPLRLTSFALYIGACLGLALLAWGAYARLLGLIIPGCLLVSMGPGVYAAWTAVNEPSALSRTGIMLVAFALGWGLITVFSRVIKSAFVWWPLIPGGILAMVGWGLYIGGNPENALSFIGNTGSIGLIIFGVYLLLLRRGIQR